MHYSSEIQIIDLLARRETEFLRVWTCEQEIGRLLNGVAFPFSAPPPLPSHAHGRRQKLKVTLTPTAAALDANGSRMVLRRLQPTENAYRLTYAFKGEKHSSFSTDLDFISKLPRLSCADFRLLRVEAGCYCSMEQFEVTEVLWQRDER